ncbi:hypothetical protein SADUNF_Sadunf16G0278200 [Salix dunnii]|uniref:Uncharacterized protein n=1 Tax=Salix dunnii TaxID=1413687 RepID=A0A835JEJ5_9ROSI|nr:hypothetical protein SADUNF_Sadunf16G0278200 [Salix dunnii]
MLEVIGETMQDLILTRVAIIEFFREVLQVKGMGGVNLEMGFMWIHTNSCISSTLNHILLLWNENKFGIVFTNNKSFVICENHS